MKTPAYLFLLLVIISLSCQSNNELKRTLTAGKWISADFVNLRFEEDSVHIEFNSFLPDQISVETFIYSIQDDIISIGDQSEEENFYSFKFKILKITKDTLVLQQPKIRADQLLGTDTVLTFYSDPSLLYDSTLTFQGLYYVMSPYMSSDNISIQFGDSSNTLIRRKHQFDTDGTTTRSYYAAYIGYYPDSLKVQVQEILRYIQIEKLDSLYRIERWHQPQYYVEVAYNNKRKIIKGNFLPYGLQAMGNLADAVTKDLPLKRVEIKNE